jgi:hypothetical protein
MFDRLMALVNHEELLEAPKGMTTRLLGRCWELIEPRITC